jgi:hypothetical protein
VNDLVFVAIMLAFFNVADEIPFRVRVQREQVAA